MLLTLAEFAYAFNTTNNQEEFIHSFHYDKLEDEELQDLVRDAQYALEDYWERLSSIDDYIEEREAK